MHMSGRGGTTVYGLTSQRVALELVNMQFGVEFLGESNLPLRPTCSCSGTTSPRSPGFCRRRGKQPACSPRPESDRLIVSATPDGVIAALPPDAVRVLDTFHFDGARHGHNLKLTADPLLWASAPSTAPLLGFAPDQPAVSSAAAAAFATITPDEILEHRPAL